MISRTAKKKQVLHPDFAKSQSGIMRLFALAVVFGALHVCQAFRTKTSRAWEGAVVKPVTFQSPETPLQAECSGAMGRSGLLGLLKRLPQHLIESFMIVCSTMKDGDRTSINTVVDRIMTFVAHLLAEFDATNEDYDPTGAGNDPGYLAGYLKKLLEGTAPMPSFDSDDKEVMDFFQGLSLSERRPLWRTAKFYNQMTDLTTL